jgi:hypothetical protein
VKKAITPDTGHGDVYHYYIGDEPPLEQYILHGGKWEPLVDGYYLMDLVIDGSPELTGPVKQVESAPPPRNSGHRDRARCGPPTRACQQRQIDGFVLIWTDICRCRD